MMLMLLFTYGLVIPKLMKLPSHVRTRTVYHESNAVTCSEYKCCFLECNNFQFNQQLLVY